MHATTKVGSVLVSLVALAVLVIPGQAFADVFLSLTATQVAQIRLQNYVPEWLSLWYTGSTCGSGALTLPSSSSISDRNRLWSTTLTAKLSTHGMFFYYDNTTNPGSCVITSFGIDN